MASISLRQLEKTYSNGHTALKNINLDIDDGELVVLAGSSGCGKSTLLRLIAGLIDISSGVIEIDGKRANELSPKDRNVAMVFQDYALYPMMSVRGNLEFPLKMRGLDRKETTRRVDRMARLLELEPYLNHLPKELSGGQRQRVAMGRALVREPSVFLLDEPLSNLDIRLRAQVRSEIRDLQQRTGTTMIYVTHDQTEAMTLGRRIAIINQGRIEQIDDPQSIYLNPASAFVAGFVGSPPMNLFQTEILPVEQRIKISCNSEILTELTPSNAAAQKLWQFMEGSAADRHKPGHFRATVGIRPEALQFATLPDTGFRAMVKFTEYLGHETLVHFLPFGLLSEKNEPDTFIMRVPGLYYFQPHTIIRLEVVPDSIHFFPDDNS